MKRFCVALLIPLLTAPLADAHCYSTGCYNAVETVAVPYAVPVAVAIPYSYFFSAPAAYVAPTTAAAAPVATTTTVSATIDADAIADKIVAKLSPVLTASTQQMTAACAQQHSDAQAIIAAINGGPPTPAPQPPSPAPPVPQNTPAAPNVPASPVPPAKAAAAPPVTATPAGGLLVQKCGQCHSGVATAKKPNIAEFTAEGSPWKLKAVRSLLAGTMPKGGKLTADERGALIEELTR